MKIVNEDTHRRQKHLLIFKQCKMKKTSRLSGKLMAAAFAALSVFAFSSCSKDLGETDDRGITYTISGNASGSQMVPAVTGTGSANIAGTYNTSTNQLMYTSTWTGLTGGPNSAGFYMGATGQAGTMVGSAWTLGTNTTAAGTFSGNMTLTEAQEADLLAGRWYYTLGTTTNASGEVRGQIMATPQ
jgi:hypothetical protein